MATNFGGVTMKPYTWYDLERDLEEYCAWLKAKPKWWQVKARRKWKKANPLPEQNRRIADNG